MPTPALDSQPELDEYTTQMVDAFNYICKGSTEQGMIPVSEIDAYYRMFEEYLVETKHDFIYLIHVMNQPVLKNLKEQLDRVTKGRH